MRDIKALDCDTEFNQSNFGLVEYRDANAKGKANPVVSSRKVAEVFEKEHYNVIRDIKALDCGTEFNALNFEATSRTVAMPRGGTREEPEYIMPRIGFSVLTMGFTGAKELKWKIQYAETFDFEKLRKHVIESIRALECDTDFTGLNFRLSEYNDATGRRLPEYLMNRIGFSVLTMGFTGAKAQTRLRFSKSTSLDGRDAPRL